MKTAAPPCLRFAVSRVAFSVVGSVAVIVGAAGTVPMAHAAPSPWTLYSVGGQTVSRHDSFEGCKAAAQAAKAQSGEAHLCTATGEAVVAAGFEPSGMPRVKRSAIGVAAATDRFKGERIKALGIDPATQQPANPSVFMAYPNPNDIGAFRESCAFAGMNFDDALVFPGRPGVSHLHTYFGVLSDAGTNSDNIRAAPWSTCAGGTLNNTSYWMPAIIDTATGVPQVPASNNVYYKCPYGFGR